MSSYLASLMRLFVKRVRRKRVRKSLGQVTDLNYTYIPPRVCVNRMSSSRVSRDLIVVDKSSSEIRAILCTALCSKAAVHVVQEACQG